MSFGAKNNRIKAKTGEKRVTNPTEKHHASFGKDQTISNKIELKATLWNTVNETEKAIWTGIKNILWGAE